MGWGPRLHGGGTWVGTGDPLQVSSKPVTVSVEGAGR